MEKKGQTIYTYRYMWLTKASKEADKVNVRLITGVPEEHAAFIKTLQESGDVINATRCYVCEYDVAQMDLYEKVKLVLGEDEEDEPQSTVVDEEIPNLGNAVGGKALYGAKGVEK